MLNDPRIWGTHLKRREVVMNEWNDKNPNDEPVDQKKEKQFSND